MTDNMTLCMTLLYDVNIYQGKSDIDNQSDIGNQATIVSGKKQGWHGAGPGARLRSGVDNECVETGAKVRLIEACGVEMANGEACL
jgi:hypothetical protein